MIRRPPLRLVAATFVSDAAATAAGTALAGYAGVVELKVHPRRPASDREPAYAVVVARVGLPLRDVVRRTIAEHGGQVVIDLDDELGGSSKRSG